MKKAAKLVVLVIVATATAGVVRSRAPRPVCDKPSDNDDDASSQTNTEFGVFPPYVWLVLNILALGIVLSTQADDPWTAFGVLGIGLSALIVTPNLLAHPLVVSFEDRHFNRWKELSERRVGVANHGDRVLHTAQRTARRLLYVFGSVLIILTIASAVFPNTLSTTRGVAMVLVFYGVVASFVVLSATLVVAAGWHAFLGREGAAYVHYRTLEVEEGLRQEPVGLVVAAILFFVGTALAFIGAYLP